MALRLLANFLMPLVYHGTRFFLIGKLLSGATSSRRFTIEVCHVSRRLSGVSGHTAWI